MHDPVPNRKESYGCIDFPLEDRCNRAKISFVAKVDAIKMEELGSLGNAEPLASEKYARSFTLRGKIFAALCIPLICFAVYYSPTLTSLGWHIIHGQAIDYRGLRVEVPWGWTADLSLMKEDFAANPQGITLQKPPKTLNIESRGPELIYINLLLPDTHSTPQQQAAEWQNLFRGSHPTSDFNLAPPANPPAGADCIEATPRAASGDLPSGAALACISITQGWLANYAGTQNNVPLFLNVVSTLKK